MAARIIRALRALSAELGVHIVTPEYEVLLALLSEVRLSAEQLLELSSRSRAGFYHVIARLKRSKLIVSEPGVDKRSRVYSLPPPAVETLVSAIGLMRANPGKLPVHASAAGADTARRTKMSSLLAQLPQLSCEYQILVRLFLYPGATTKEVADEVSASKTKFYASLAGLLKRKVIRRETCASDGRLRRFFLEPTAEAAIARTYRQVMSWIDELEQKEHADIHAFTWEGSHQLKRQL